MSPKKERPAPPENDTNAPVATPPAVPIWMMGVGTVVTLLVCFIAVTAIRQQKPKAPLRLSPEEMKPAAAVAGPEPAPWTYDSVTNQHWDPGHKHWHPGPPSNQGHAGVAPRTAPDIPNPAPWQYDATSNQYFDPDHGHWHSGQPPAGKGAGGPTPAPAAPEAQAPPAPEAPAPVSVEEAAPAQ